MKLPQLFKYAYEAIKNALICICFQNRNVNAGRSLVSFCWVYTYHFGDLFFFFYHSINQKIATTFRDQMLYKSGYELFMDNPYLWTILTMGIKLEGLMWALLKKRFLTQECEKIKTCIVKKKWQTIAVKLPQSYFMIWYVLCITSFWYFLFCTYLHYFASTKVWTKNTLMCILHSSSPLVWETKKEKKQVTAAK